MQAMSAVELMRADYDTSCAEIPGCDKENETPMDYLTPRDRCAACKVTVGFATVLPSAASRGFIF